jgi:hypothetical protein
MDCDLLIGDFIMTIIKAFVLWTDLVKNVTESKKKGRSCGKDNFTHLS